MSASSIFEQVSNRPGEGVARSRGVERAREFCRRFAAETSRLFRGVARYVMFVGHPRSGHSVIGALLNAHRHALVSHNLDALDYLREGFSRDDLFCLILERERWLAGRGRVVGGYRYEVPGQWQGYHEELRVVGDKRAGASSRHLARDPTLLSTLHSRLALPIHVIHHVRNPWDNIGSILARPDVRRGRSLAEIVDDYFRLLEAATAGIAAAGTDVRTTVTRHEELMRDPRAVMGGILADLGLEAPPDHLDACARFVHASERRTRLDAAWTPELREAVAERARRFEVLSGYSFAS